MSATFWIVGGGNWATAADWSTGLVPGAADDAFVSAPGGYTVSITTPITVGSVSVDNASATLAVSDPGATATVTGNLDDGGGLLVDASGGQGGTTLAIGGTLLSNNFVGIGNSALSAPTLVTANALADTGTIQIIGSASNRATLDIGAPAGFGVTGVLTGAVNMTGDALLEFASGQITDVTGSLTLDGTQAFVADSGSTGSNSALTGLSDISGTLNLRDGASISVSGNLENTGQISVDNFSNDSGSSLSVAGTLTNMGGLAIGGTSLTAPDTVTVGGLVNTGGIGISGNASAGNRGTLDVTAAAGTGAPGLLSGSIGLSGDALLEFASGQITNIAGTLTIDGPQAFVADSGSTSSNSALTGLSDISGTLNVRDGASVSVGGNLASTGQISVDNFSNDSGSSLSVGGTLTDMGGLNIGGTSLTLPDTMTVGGLINSGGIGISGNASAGNRGTLDVNAAAGTGAPGLLTGNINLSGDALLEFASGQITNIAGFVVLQGPQAFVANSGSPGSNSALTGLSDISGTLYLRDGAAVSAGGGLENSGQINVDAGGDSGGSSLSIAGTLANFGGIAIGNLGSLTAAPATVTAARLVNVGTIGILGDTSALKQGILNITTAAGTGAPGLLTGNIGLGGDALLEFASGQITTIAGTLTLDGSQVFAADVGATSSNSALTGLSDISGTLNLRDGAAVSVIGDLESTGTLNVDNTSNDSGSSLSVAGTLTNAGNLGIGGTGLTLPDTVTVGGLVNSGGLGISGSATGQATLIVNGPASNTGNLSIGAASALDVSGDYTEIAGTTTVTGILAAATIDVAGGMLDGTGTVSGNVDDIGGILLAGTNTPGTLTINGNLALGATGVLQALITGTASSQIGTVNVSGSATLAGGILDLDFSNFTPGLGQSFTVLTFTAGSLTGTFGTIDDGGLLGNGSSVDIGGGLALALTYNNAGGNITAQVVSSSAADTWNGSTANWSTAADWSSGVPGPTSTAVLGGSSGYTVTINAPITAPASLDISDSSATLAIADATTVLTTGDTTNVGALNVDTSDTGGSSVTIGGALRSNGLINIGNSAITTPVTVTAGGLDIAAAGNGSEGSVTLVGGSTARAELNILAAAPATLAGRFSLASDALLQFASGGITAIGANAGLTLNSSAAQVTINGQAGNNNALTGLSGNAGTLDLIAGASITTNASLNFLNAGALYLDTFIQPGGSSLTIGGVLTNTGNMQLGAGGLEAFDNNGIIASDTVIAAGLDNLGSIVMVGSTAPGSSAQALVNILAAAPTTLTGKYNLSGNALLQFASGGITAIDANANLTLTASTPQVAISGKTGNNNALTGLADNAGTLDLIAGASITTNPGTNFDNAGALDLDSFIQPGGSALTIGGVLTNTGAIQLGASGLEAFDNNGIIASDVVTAAGLDNLGSIGLAGSTAPGSSAQALLNILGAAPATLTGKYNLSGNALLQFASGSITAIGGASGLALTGGTPQVAISGHTGNNNALTGLSDNAGTLDLVAGASITTSPGINFDNTGTIDLDSFFQPGGSALTVGGVLTNSGDIFIGNSGFNNSGITASDVLTAGGLDNLVAQNAEIVLAGNTTPGSTAQAELNILSAAPTTLTGTFNLSGNALLQFASGGITAIGGTSNLTLSGATPQVKISGATSNNSALTGLSDNAGTLDLIGGASITTSPGVNFDNTGTVDLDTFYQPGGSALTIGGVLTNSGNLAVGNNGFNNSGITASDIVTAAGLDNLVNGEIALTGNTTSGSTALAELNVLSAAPSTITGNFDLSGNALLQFASGGITTIGGSSRVTLNGGTPQVAISGATGNNSALATLAENDGTLQLLNGAAITTKTGTGFDNTGSLQVDANGGGGGSLGIGGVLTNTGNAQIGNDGLSTATPVSASGLTNAGTFNMSESTVALTGALDNSGHLNVGDAGLSLNATLVAATLDNIAAGTIALTGSGTGATAALIVQSLATNAANLQLNPGGFAEFGALDNTGTISILGNLAQPSSLGVIGSAANDGEITIGGFANMGVTGSFDDKGSVVLAGTLDIAGPMTVDPSGSLLLQGGGVVGNGSLTIDAGAAVSGNGTVAVALTNNTMITATGGLLDVTGPTSGSGQFTIASSSELELGGASAEAMSFGGNVGTLKFDSPQSVTGAINGLVKGDAIDLAGVQATSAVVNGSTLTVTAGSQTLSYQVSGAGLSGNVFAIENDQHGGTNLVLGPPGPVIGGPTTQTVFVQYPAVLGPLTVYDPIAGSGILTVVVTSGSGLLAAVPANGGTVTGNVSSSVTLTGTLAEINTELAGLAYVGFNPGVDNITVSVTDPNNLTTTQKIAVTTVAVPNIQPVLNAPSEIIEIANLPMAIPGVSINDPFAQATGRYDAIELTSGQPTIFTANGTGGVLLGQGTSDLAVAGSASQVNGYFADDALAEAGAALSFAAGPIGTFAKAASFIYTIYQLEKKPTDLENLQSGADLLIEILAKARDIELPKPLFPFAFFQVGATAVNFVLGALNALASGKETPNNAEVINFELKLLNQLIGLTVFPTGGDAHIVSSGGVSYDFSAAGEFVLTKSTQPGNSFQVQIRLTPQNGSQSVSVITQAAAAVGSDRVTFGLGRTSFVQVDGAPASSLSTTTPMVLAGGEVKQISVNGYQVIWNTGETLTVTNNGTYLDLVTGLAGSDGAGSVAGLLGTSNGAANDFTLPNGTVLSQPLTSAELYGTFANAWRVTGATSLFDYGPGQSTATFTDTSFPQASVTLAQLEAGLPAALIQQAKQVVVAAGITDPGVQQLAEFDYLSSGGNPSVVAEDASQLLGATTIPMVPTSSSPPPPLLAVFPTQVSIPQASSGATAVTFNVDLTAPEGSDTVVDYTVISPEAGDLTAAAFGGTLPSGQITLAAGATTGQFIIDVPQGALGSSPAETVVVQISSPGNVPVFATTARETVTQPLAGPPAIPELEYLGKFGDFSRSGTNYTLDLGALQIGELLPPLQFGIANAASAPADQLTGTFTVAPVAGFSVTNAGIPSPIAAGQSINGPTIETNQIKFGANSETITFDPVDTNASGFSAPLAPITLTIADTLELPGMVYSQAFGDVHIITYNGLKYDFQATGDFTLAQSRVPGDNFQIQMELKPWYAGASVTTIHQVAIALGPDRVTFDWTRPNTVMVDGAAAAGLGVGNPLVLGGGTITEVSPSMFKVSWNTGETMTVTNITPFYPGEPDFIDITDGIPGNFGPNAFAGLQGENAGMQNDFQLADGTVLPQPLTTAELYGAFANAWQVSPANSLFDGAGPAFSAPADPVTLADLPANLVAQAAQLVAAVGITDPGLAQSAELDFLATGDPGFIAAAKNIQQQVGATFVGDAAGGTPAPAIGVAATTAKVVEAAGGPTAVTFTAYLTATESADTTINYTVNVGGPDFLGATAFGGTLPSGSVTIAAGQTTAQFVINVPQGALGTVPSDNLQVMVSDAAGIPVFAPTAQTEVVNSAPEPGATARPAFAKITGDGTLSFNAATDTYTLALGGLIAGDGLQPVQLALVNAAGAPADSLGGSFTAPTGTGFSITGNNLPSPLGAGQSYQGLYVSVNNFATGANTMSMTFDPTDVNDSGYSAALAPITLKITDTITPPAQPRVNTPTTIIFPNVHVGGIDSQHVSVTNTAAAGAGNLDVTLSAGGNATVTGAITGLAPGATDASSLSVGIDTSVAGARSGGVTEKFVSDAGGGNTMPIAEEDPYIDVFGGVYRLAQASLLPANLTVHVGAPGTQAITLTNLDPNDGYSENLIATVIGTTGAVIASGTTGDIKPQQDGVISVKFSTAAPGTIGTVTLDLKSDGTGIDGLGVTDLGNVTIPVAVTSGNVPAAAQFEELSGGGTFTHVGSAYSLSLGTISAPVTVNLGVLNSAVAPADALGGSFTIAGDSAFANSAFAAFSGIAAGAADTAPMVTLGTGTPGTFSEIITLLPLDASGASNLPLGPETLTITGTVAPPQLAGQIAALSATESVALPSATSVATFKDTNASDAATVFSATINWGDGATTSGAVTGSNGVFTVTGGHTYTEEGSFPLGVTITDTGNNKTLPLTGTVTGAEGDVLTPQGVSFTATPGQAFSGTVATFTDTYTGNVAGDFTATINWGDGTTTAGGLTDTAGAMSVTGTHTYANVGQDTVTVTVTEDVPGTAAASAISTAHVTQAAGQLSGQVSLKSATEGLALAGTTVVATFSDSSTTDLATGFTASINWGDGTTTAGTVSGASGSFAVSGGHTYADEGPDSAIVTITRTADQTQITPSGTVNVADAALSAKGVSLTGTEGGALSGVTVATFTDANPGALAADFAATINWGDNTSSIGTVGAAQGGGFAVSGSHTYADEGSYTVSVAISDDGGGTASASSTATVADAALSAKGASVGATEGGGLINTTVATFTDVNLNATAADFAATINWGDNTSSSGTIGAGLGGGFDVGGSHTYADEGSYQISVTITDKGGSTASASTTATVADAPLLATGVSVGATEGGGLINTTVATFTDINPNAAATDFAATINWGDNTSSTGTVGAGQGGGFDVGGSHTYADEGSYQISVTITDKGGSIASASSTATVADAALSAKGVSVGATEGGGLINTTVGTFTDVNPNATAADFAATINWGDNTSSSGTIGAAQGGGFDVGGSHTYADEGSYQISVTITDKGGSTASASTTATIADAPLLATGASVGATEGGGLINTTVATFTDVNPNATAADFAATINWGDNTSSTGTIGAGQGGGFDVVGSHTYADEGSYQISVTINDKGGSIASASSTATVAEADVLVGQGTSIAAFVNQPLANVALATFTDSFAGNQASDFTATINWGDGVTTSGTVSGGNGTFTVSGSHTYAAVGQDTVTVTLADDAPGAGTASATDTVSVGSVKAAPRIVVSEGITDVNITDFLGGGTITSVSAVNYPAHLPAKGYQVTLVDGQVYLTVANNLPSGGGLSAPKVTFQYTVAGQVETATIKAVNVTPGNNSNTLNLTDPRIGPYDFSYIAGQKHGQEIVFATGATSNVLAFTSTSDSTNAKFDIVVNFNPSSDRLDFSQISGILSVHALGTFAAIPSGNVVAANGISWLVDTATNQTIVYVDPSSAPESAATASMKIVLSGEKALSGNDFILSDPPPFAPAIAGQSAVFWSQQTSDWNGAAGDDSKAGKLVASGVLSSTDVLYSLPTHGLDLDGTPQTNPSYGQVGVLLGDSNGDGRTDNGEATLFVPLAAADQLINAGDTALDARQVLMKQAIAAQLNIDNGDPDPGLSPGTSAGHDLIDEAVSWLRGLAPFTYAGGSTGNVDINHDGLLEAGGSSTAGIEYNTSTGAFTSAALSASKQAWQGYVDPIRSPPQTGDLMVSGQDLKNALSAFNIDQLVASMAGFQVGWNNNGVVTNISANSGDAFWTVLKDNHVIAGPTHA